MKLPSRRSSYLVVAGALSILLGLTGAWSQTARTVKIVVPYPAGGTADILARILVEQISRTEGVTLLTENALVRVQSSEPKLYPALHPTAAPC